MHILILGAQPDDSPEAEASYYEGIVRFFRDAPQHDIGVSYALFNQLLFRVEQGQSSIYDTHNQCDLSAYDAVFIRGQFRKRMDMVFAISRYLHEQGKLVVNDYSHARTSSKLSQAFVFTGLNIPTPDTLCGSGQTLLDAAKSLALPFICKEVYGAHGRNNHLITSYEQLQSILQDGESLFVLQEFIANDGDFRLLCIGNGHLIIKRTAADGSHLNNTSQGGKAELLPNDALPTEVLDAARRCLTELHMTMAGVDVIFDKDKQRYLFLEVNSQPQIVTGAFLEDKQKLLGAYLDELAASGK